MNEQIREAAIELTKIYSQSPNVSLLFPIYHNENNNNLRVSEQESKIVLANIFIKNHIPFSIEVPTITKHSFSGEKDLSARFDMATYAQNSRTDFNWVIELKAHNPSQKSIEKDFEKMVASKCNCIWFHTLENEYKGTIPSLLKKFNNALTKEIEHNEGTHMWIIGIVVLRKKRLYLRKINLNGKDFSSIDDISKYKYEVLT